MAAFGAIFGPLWAVAGGVAGLIAAAKTNRADLADLREAARLWTPDDHQSEAEFRDSFIRFLRLKLHGAEVRREVDCRGGRVDIDVDGRIAVELKHNLTSADKLKKLIGQIETYRTATESDILVLLVGETGEDYVQRLNEHLDKQWAGERERIAVDVKRAAPALASAVADQ